MPVCACYGVAAYADGALTLVAISAKEGYKNTNEIGGWHFRYLGSKNKCAKEYAEWKKQRERERQCAHGEMRQSTKTRGVAQFWNQASQQISEERESGSSTCECE